MASLPHSAIARQVDRAGKSSSGGGGLGDHKGSLRPHSVAVDTPFKATGRRTFFLTLETSRGDGIHGLRAILKILLRRHGFRCTDAREVSE
jgi:hypothetical protein